MKKIFAKLLSRFRKKEPQYEYEWYEDCDGWTVLRKLN